MISFISSFEIICAVVPDPRIFFLTAASVADAAAVNLNGTKTLLANGVSTFFINGKPAVINGLRKLKNPPSWLVIGLVARFNKILLLSTDLITFIIPFTSFFVSVIPEPLPVLYYLLNLSICLSRKSFPKSLAISVPFLARFDKILA